MVGSTFGYSKCTSANGRIRPGRGGYRQAAKFSMICSTSSKMNGFRK